MHFYSIAEKLFLHTSIKSYHKDGAYSVNSIKLWNSACMFKKIINLWKFKDHQIILYI